MNSTENHDLQFANIPGVTDFECLGFVFADLDDFSSITSSMIV